jgi:WYL domain/ABC transporter
VKEYLEGAGGILRGDLVTVKVVFSKTVARYIKERLWHPSQRFRDLPNGQVEVTLRVADTLEVRQWILGYGVHAVVREPTALRDALRDEAEALVRRLTPQRRPLAVTPSPPARRRARPTVSSLASTGTPRRSLVRPSPPQRLPARGRDAMWRPLIGAVVMVPISEVLDSTVGDRLPGIQGVVYGGTLIQIMLYLPEGLYWRVCQALRARDERGAAAARPPIVAPADDAVVVAPDGAVLLEVRRVSKAFLGLQALAEVIQRARGRDLGLIGTNGAGKTTLFSVLNGFLVPERGEVRFLGEAVMGCGRAPSGAAASAARSVAWQQNEERMPTSLLAGG